MLRSRTSRRRGRSSRRASHRSVRIRSIVVCAPHAGGAQLDARLAVLSAALIAHDRFAEADHARFAQLRERAAAVAAARAAAATATATATTGAAAAAVGGGTPATKERSNDTDGRDSPRDKPASLGRSRSVARDPAAPHADSARRAAHFRATFTRADALAYLADKPVNTFVTRPSRLGPNAKALSYVSARDGIKHIVVHSERGQYWLDGTEERFDSIVDLLVAYHFVADPDEEKRKEFD